MLKKDMLCVLTKLAMLSFEVEGKRKTNLVWYNAVVLTSWEPLPGSEGLLVFLDG